MEKLEVEAKKDQLEDQLVNDGTNDQANEVYYQELYPT